MKFRSQAFALVTAAGCACTVAMAQPSDSLYKSKTPQRAPHALRALHVRDGGTVDPIRVEVNGVEMPFILTHSSDSQFVLYNNVNTGDVLFASTTHQYRTLDDFTFAGGQSAVITGLEPSWATPATITVPTTETVTIDFQFFGTLNPAVTPVNGPPASNTVRVTYAAPAAGWAVSSVYTGAAFILATAGNNITASSGAVDVRVLRGTTLTPHPDFDPAFGGNGVTVGTGNDVAWFDLNNDGIYQGADAGAGNEGINFGGGAGQLANLRLAIQGRYIEPTVGACCLSGSCVILTSSQCTGLSGVYNGDGSTCASVAGHCATPPVLHNNGPLNTGTVALNGLAAPAGSSWCEGVQEGTCTTTVNGPNVSGTFRIADDFTVPANKQWAINKLTIYAYNNAPGSTTVSPVTGITLRIWNGSPDNPASTVVFGDTTTNRYVVANASWTTMYRIFNSGILAQAPGTTRPIWQFGIPVSVTLPAGTYWIDYSVTGGPFGPQVTLMTNASNGVRNQPAANALQFVATPPPPNTTPVWQLIGENGGQAGCLAGHYDMPFIVEGVESSTGSNCYANCDGSTAVPFLNISDFVCFQGAFAAGSSYANCDNSTSPPVLNISDFVCFQGQFAAGCSAP